MNDGAGALTALDLTVGPVVAVLDEISPGLPDVMVVGAVCRDFLHRSCGHDPSVLRRTDDLDIAIAVNGWDHLDALTDALVKVTGQSSRIRFRIAGVTVDVVPFGERIESPDGVVAPRGRHDDPMSVFAFQDVWASAHRVQLDNGVTVRVPTISGYTALKLKAWADRSAHGQYKDAADLATAMSWYQHDLDRVDSLYSSPTGNDLLVESEMDVPEAAVRLLVADARAQLRPERQDELASVWQTVDDDLLVDNLVHPTLTGWPRRGDDRLSRYVRAIRAMLHR